MRNGIERRIEALEQKAKPPVISTFLDLIIWANEHVGEEVELSPELQALVEDAAKESG